MDNEVVGVLQEIRDELRELRTELHDIALDLEWFVNMATPLERGAKRKVQLERDAEQRIGALDDQDTIGRERIRDRLQRRLREASH